MNSHLANFRHLAFRNSTMFVTEEGQISFLFDGVLQQHLNEALVEQEVAMRIFGVVLQQFIHEQFRLEFHSRLKIRRAEIQIDPQMGGVDWLRDGLRGQWIIAVIRSQFF
jgi:hypothetical protein